jgi:hypothetical protein
VIAGKWKARPEQALSAPKGCLAFNNRKRAKRTQRKISKGLVGDTNYL